MSLGSDDHVRVMMDCYTLIKKYKWLVDGFVLDFFTESIWEQKMPASWKAALTVAQPADFANLINLEEESVSFAWPLELLALRTLIRQLAVKRIPVTKRSFEEIIGAKLDSSNSEWRSFQDELSEAAGQHRGLAHVFRKHVKPKKQHEIARLCDVIRTVSSKTSVSNIIDVGSGLGHLSRLLSFGHNFKVTCVDAESDLSTTANKFDAELVSATRKKKEAGVVDSSNELVGPRHITLRITSSLKGEIFQFKIFGTNTKRFGIVGLHTCGDLGPTLLKVFRESTSAKFLVLVGCCYMKIENTFPLNRDLFPGQEDPLLSYSARELACHAIESYRARLVNSDELEKLKVHCNRAVLEYVIVSLRPEMRRVALKSVAHSYALPFHDYALRATQNLDINLNKCQLTSTDVREKVERWKEVLAFYMLRLLMAPVIENFLLMDRLVYLRRQNLDAWVLPVFDPGISPRNHVLVALKS